ncbi:hypothetical protein OSB04_010110 [Centaurea solstitialis]|uniref:Peptidoglycan binding-like domain-containing protein n=1 Tax=Centaurea solstitialis TaxID=347529 RepID=A0AA38TK41_9ASTR|nr:hypothetical protein OSB04_010110 [Centaurea solstitialis]
MSSSLPLTFNSLLPWQKSSKISPESITTTFTFPNFNKSTSLILSKPHICFTFSNSGSDYEREESRWLREEQRWLREEQRWMREERRWEAERETLIDEIEALKVEIEEMRREGGNGNGSVAKMLRVLKKEVNRIGESGSSASPLVVEAVEEAVEDAVEVEEAEEVVVKEVVRVVEERKGGNVEKKKRAMLRVGSQGAQEALQKLGFYCGEEDEEFSSFSSGTERAVKTWQASIGVPETGVMTSELLERLYMDPKEGDSGFKEGENGVAVTPVTKVPEVLSGTVKEYVESDVYDTRVFLLGENRWEDSSRLKFRNKQDSQTDSKGVETKRCMTCCGVGHLQCEECDGTGEPNIEPQFLEWVGEETKCPYCEGVGHSICDVCHGTGVASA